MKKSNILLSIFIVIVVITVLYYADEQNGTKEPDSFSFVFMTDIHLQHELNAVTGLNQAIDTINKINPDFVITGGDQIMDALGVSYDEATAAYALYLDVIKNVKAPVYNTLGNHDIFGVYSTEESILKSPEYGEKMFENKIGKSYQSFVHKGWKFIILNTIEENDNKKYHGLIDDAQVSWIKNELSKTDANMPIVISTHFPFVSAYNQQSTVRTVASSSSWIIDNSKEILNLFKDYNLKLVLQGHLHIREDICIDGVRYITGGAISANWWEGPYQGVEEGFLKITAFENSFDYEYIDYGWEALNE